MSAANPNRKLMITSGSPAMEQHLAKSVRSRLVTFITKNHRSIPFISNMSAANPNRKLKITSGSPGTEEHPKSLPPFPTEGWKDKLSHYFKYCIIGSPGHDAEAIDDLEMRFDYDEKDLDSEESLRKLYDRWLKHYGVTRYWWNKKVHFEAFKESAHIAQICNRLVNDRVLGLNNIADYTEYQRWKKVHRQLLRERKNERDAEKENGEESFK